MGQWNDSAAAALVTQASDGEGVGFSAKARELTRFIRQAQVSVGGHRVWAKPIALSALCLIAWAGVWAALIIAFTGRLAGVPVQRHEVGVIERTVRAGPAVFVPEVSACIE
jgi:hypothetical protein